MSYEVDWVAIREEFEKTNITLAALADKHRLKRGTVRSRKSREGWQKQQVEVKNATQRNKKETENVATEVTTENDANKQEKPPLRDLTPGGPIDNKSAVVTGEYEAIWHDTLEDEEKELYYHIQLDKIKQVDNEIRLTEIRERRMMKRIAELAGLTLSEVEQSYSQGVSVKGPFQKQSIKYEANLERIQRIEEALTRVQVSKSKLIELKHKLEKETGATGKVGNLDTLVGLVMLGSDDP